MEKFVFDQSSPVKEAAGYRTRVCAHRLHKLVSFFGIVINAMDVSKEEELQKGNQLGLYILGNLNSDHHNLVLQLFSAHQ